MDLSTHRIAVLCLLLVAVCCVNTQGIADAKNLRTYIFTTNTYDSKVRPIDNQSLAIDVYVSFYLLALNSLDEVSEVMTTTGYLYVVWQDEQLDWTPASYGGITASFWPQGDIWRPDIALKNSAIRYKPLGDSSLNVYVTNTGLVVWQPFQVFESTCSVTITYFPFDIQTCKLEFTAWSYSKAEVMMLGDSARGIDLSSYQKNPSWDVLETSWSANFDTYESSITFTIKLQRKPLYVILSIVLPILLLSILNIFTFVLPCEGGEKSGYAVTIFLAFAVFLTIVESTLPDNSESVAIFSIYVLMMTFMSTIITIITLIGCRVSAWDESEVRIPSCLKSLANMGRCLPCRNLCCKRRSNNKIKDECKQNDDEKKPNGKNRIEPDSENEPEDKYTWRRVISGVDALCFTIFTMFAVFVNVLFLIIAGSSAQ